MYIRTNQSSTPEHEHMSPPSQKQISTPRTPALRPSKPAVSQPVEAVRFKKLQPSDQATALAMTREDRMKAVQVVANVKMQVKRRRFIPARASVGHGALSQVIDCEALTGEGLGLAQNLENTKGERLVLARVAFVSELLAVPPHRRRSNVPIHR